jgi:hypothetical protein
MRLRRVQRGGQGKGEGDSGTDLVPAIAPVGQHAHLYYFDAGQTLPASQWLRPGAPETGEETEQQQVCAWEHSKGFG